MILNYVHQTSPKILLLHPDRATHPYSPAPPYSLTPPSQADLDSTPGLQAKSSSQCLVHLARFLHLRPVTAIRILVLVQAPVPRRVSRSWNPSLKVYPQRRLREQVYDFRLRKWENFLSCLVCDGGRGGMRGLLLCRRQL